MNIKTLDQILHSEDQILLLQGSLQREYRNSKEQVNTKNKNILDFIIGREWNRK